VKILVAVAWGVVVLLLLVAGFKLLSVLVRAPDRAASHRLPPRQYQSERRQVTLFFADENASGLAPETRFAELGAGIASDAATLIAELTKGPQTQNLFPTIPSQTRLLGAYGLHTTLVLDFTQEIQTNHTGGTTGEMLTVYSIVNTVTVNFDGIEQVQILVEGHEVKTLAGHMDLSGPLPPNMNWAPTQRDTVGVRRDEMNTKAAAAARPLRNTPATTGHVPTRSSESA
jgi:germination protein M